MYNNPDQQNTNPIRRSIERTPAPGRSSPLHLQQQQPQQQYQPQNQFNQFNPQQPQQQPLYNQFDQQQPPHFAGGGSFNQRNVGGNYNQQQSQQQFGGNFQYGDPQPQQTAGTGNFNNPSQQQQQQQQQQQGGFNPSNFLNDPTAQIGMQLGTKAFEQGQQIAKENISRFFDLNKLKYYFDVNNGYVFHKLLLLVFPFRHRQWTRLVFRSEQSGQMEGYKAPRDDLNAPDMYIPVMSFVTYVLLVAITLGTGTTNQFKPEVLGLTASRSFFFIFLEVLVLKMGCYLLNVQSEVPILDLTAYCSYKFVAVCVCQVVRILTGSTMTIVWGVFAYLMLCLGLYTLRTLKYIVLPESNATVVTPVRKRRQYFLLIVAVLQIFTSFWLI